MVRVLSIWAVMLIVSKTEVDVWAHSVKPIPGNFSVHVGDITPAVLDFINLGPIAETHFSHDQDHECLGHKVQEVSYTIPETVCFSSCNNRQVNDV